MGELELYAVSAQGPQRLDVTAVENLHQLDLPFGIYEGLRTFEHTRFLYLERHLDRAERSMELLGWTYRFERDRLRRALHETASGFGHANARIRLDVLEQPARGLGSEERVLLALAPHRPIPAAVLNEGVRVGIARGKRRERPHIKLNRWIVTRRGTGPGDDGLYEHLLLDQQERILEGTSCNVFTVRDGVLSTAPGGVLVGLMRRIFLELAENASLPLRMEAAPLAEVETLDEMFLTSSTRAAVPIVEVDGRCVGDGRPGPLFRALRAAYGVLERRAAAPAV